MLIKKENTLSLFDGIFILENFLTQEEINILLEAAREEEDWVSGGGKAWENNMKFISSLNSDRYKEATDLIQLKINNRLSHYVEDDFNAARFSIHIQRFKENFTDDSGWAISPHSDRYDEANNESQFCTYGYIIYLNDDYDGGEVEYVNKDFKLSPKSGMLLVHDATKEFLHGVRKVTKGTRYMITGFIFERKKLEELIEKEKTKLD